MRQIHGSPDGDKKIPQLVSCCIPVTRDLGPVRTGVPMKVAPCWWNVETKGNIEIYVFANILFERAPIVLIDLVYIWIQYIRKVNYLIQKLRRRSDFFSITCVVGCCHNTTDSSLQVIDIRQNEIGNFDSKTCFFDLICVYGAFGNPVFVLSSHINGNAGSCLETIQSMWQSISAPLPQEGSVVD